MSHVSLGAQIRNRRVDLGLTQTQLARAVGLTQSQLSKLERGGTESSRQIGAVLDALGLALQPVTPEAAAGDACG